MQILSSCPLEKNHSAMGRHGMYMYLCLSVCLFVTVYVPLYLSACVYVCVSVCLCVCVCTCCMYLLSKGGPSTSRFGSQMQYHLTMESRSLVIWCNIGGPYDIKLRETHMRQSLSDLTPYGSAPQQRFGMVSGPWGDRHCARDIGASLKASRDPTLMGLTQLDRPPSEGNRGGCLNAA